MAALFDQDGIRFRYPENWSLEVSDHEGGWSVTVQSPDTAFFTLSYYADEPDIAALVDSALKAMREEYPVLESESALETIAHQPTIGHDVRFYSLDLTNTAWLRSFACEDGAVLILCQLNDLELETAGPVLKAICASIEIDD